MADEFIELAFEGVDRVSDPNFIYHRKRKEKRDRKLAEGSNPQQMVGGSSDRPRRDGRRSGRDRDISPPDPFDPADPRDRSIYPDARNPAYAANNGAVASGGAGGLYSGSDSPSLRGRDRGYETYDDDDYRPSRREGGRQRPQYRSRSSHQGNSTLYPDEYEDVDYPPSPRGSRSQRNGAHSSRGTKSRGSSPPKSTFAKAGDMFSDSKAGLGATAIGSIAGGYVAYRAGKSKEKSGGPEGDSMLLAILGAVAGGVGANVIERYVENGKEEGSIRDKWGDEVGSSRKKVKEKMRAMTKGDERRDEGRRQERRDRRDEYDDGY